MAPATVNPLRLLAVALCAAACTGSGQSRAVDGTPIPATPLPGEFPCLRVFAVTADGRCVRVASEDLAKIQNEILRALEQQDRTIVSPNVDLGQARRLATRPRTDWTYANYRIHAIERRGHDGDLVEIEATEPWIGDNGRRGFTAVVERAGQEWRVLELVPLTENPVHPDTP